MPITISQQDYWDLVYEAQRKKHLNHNDRFDVTWQYPKQLGQGTYREIQLRQGIELAIDNYQLNDDTIVQSPERSHSLEYVFKLAETSTQREIAHYELYGSGIAPREKWERSSVAPAVEINVHIEPEVFQSFMGDLELASMGLEHLMRKSNHHYYHRRGATTVGMQTVLHQILHCPFKGITKKLYLEGKVWELMALLVEEERELHWQKHSTSNLKPDDIDRLHHAKEILQDSLDNPPSLTELARQIGSNKDILTRGFREVFDTTAFSYLHQQRMEYARQLLLERELNVAQVAKKVGYASRSNFAIAFRKKFGVNPKVFMTKQNE